MTPTDPTPHALEREEYRVVCCEDCGLAYGSEGWIECMLPADEWAAISPTGDEGGILCITCIARRLKRRGGSPVPVMLCGTEAIRVAGQDEAFDRGWRVAEKRITELESALAAERAAGEALRTAALDCANDLEAEVRARYGWPDIHPAQQRKFDNDMQPVHTARALAADRETEE